MLSAFRKISLVYLKKGDKKRGPFWSPEIIFYAGLRRSLSTSHHPWIWSRKLDQYPGGLIKFIHPRASSRWLNLHHPWHTAHSAHAAHSAARHSAFIFLWKIGDHGFSGQHQAGNRSGVLKR